jgi:5-methylcytosine-specific restriction endonuclease McrA
VIKLPKRKAVSRKALVKKLDDVFSRYIRKRDHYICFVCGRVGSEADGVMQCGHLFSRVNYSTRWDELNAVCQCRGCNMRHEHEFEPMRRAYVDCYGENNYEDLWVRHCLALKLSQADLETLLQKFAAKLEALP